MSFVYITENGFLYGNPRLPINNETTKDTINITDEIIKIYTYPEDYFAFKEVLSIIETFPQEIQEFFCKPISHGNLAIKEIVHNVAQYDLKLSLTELFKHSFALVFKMGENRHTFSKKPLKYNLKKILKLIYTFDFFMKKGIYIPDVKLENIIYYNGNFKLIDYQDLNYHETILKDYIEKSICSNITYFVYPMDYQLHLCKTTEIPHDPINYRHKRKIINNFISLLKKIKFKRRLTFFTGSENIKVSTNYKNVEISLKKIDILEHIKDIRSITLNEIQLYTIGMLLIELLLLYDTHNNVDDIIEIILLCIIHRINDTYVVPDKDRIFKKIKICKYLYEVIL